MPVGPDDGLALSPIIKGFGGPSVDVLDGPSAVDSAIKSTTKSTTKSTIHIFFSLSPFEEVVVITPYFIDISLVNESRF
jgi:hypothetical protein